jgi:hypothetical protein
MNRYVIFRDKIKNSIISCPIPGNIERALLFTTLFLSSFILIAACGKLLSPGERLPFMDYAISFFELILIGCLAAFRKWVDMWLVAGLIFATWGGYSLFWTWAVLPCSCMGTAITLPNGFTLMIDALFFILSISMAFLLGANRRRLFLTGVNALIFFSAGFGFAEWIFHQITV